MKKELAIGQSDFKTIREQESYYVDKSLMIKEIIDDKSNIILLPRPRRFGKTLNMSMLRYFFDTHNATHNRKLFAGLKIENETVFDTEQGKYPVIFLTFKDVKNLTYPDALFNIKLLISKLFDANQFLLESDLLTQVEKSIYEQIINFSVNQPILEKSLSLFIELYYRYFKQKPILLIDEYDTPVHTAYSNNYYDDMIGFMRVFLGEALKDNLYLYKGILTGTLRISKESIFTGLNNLSVYTLLKGEFNSCFGFTHEELHLMLEFFGLLELESEIRHWYNGYIIGDIEIYNPWSIVSFVASKDKFFIPYWVNTSGNDLIKELIIDSPHSVRTELQDLLTDKPLVKSLEDNISFPELKKTENAVFSFLVFSGYLKAKFIREENKRFLYELLIPNTEVKILFDNIILGWFKETFDSDRNKVLLNALLDKDIELFEEVLGECVLNSLSCYDVPKRDVERVYQAFLLGMLVSLESDYEVTSNKESGYGRYDICILPLKSKKPAIIMELKRIRPSETAETALASALKQIEEKQYETSIRQRGYTDILKLAVVFDGKRVWAKTS